jgi:hypothetical protein
MTYGRAPPPGHKHPLDGTGVSHVAELVRGTALFTGEGPLIRPYGPPSPQGEKGKRRLCAPN